MAQNLTATLARTQSLHFRIGGLPFRFLPLRAFHWFFALDISTAGNES